MRLEFSSDWIHEKTPQGDLYYRGDAEAARKVSEMSADANIREAIAEAMKEAAYYSSGAYVEKNRTIFWTDHIRTWPIFYGEDSNGALLVSDEIEKFPAQAANDVTALEMIMAGYATGRHTMKQGVSSILAGEAIVATDRFERIKYYTYKPNYADKSNDVENCAKLDAFLDSSIKAVIKRAKGREIWLPLSGGLDSRVLLCKLHQWGAGEQVKTFSYGPTNNFEARRAKKVAKTLNVPWQMVSPPKDYLKKLFDSDVRKKFWAYASEHKAVPCMREFGAFCYLRDQNIIPADAVIINGQSGDYITGGHIPEKWCKPGTDTHENFFKTIIDKHYSLWLNMLTTENLARVKERIASTLEYDLPATADNIYWAKCHEEWEYEARQVCYVANGQRVYEFLGHDWEMPLWERPLVDMCEHWRAEDKQGQSLYKKYLKSYNYKGLFPEKETYIWRWP